MITQGNDRRLVCLTSRPPLVFCLLFDFLNLIRTIMKLSINVKLYAMKDYVYGDVTKSCVRNVFRSLVVDVTKSEEVPLVSDLGYALAVLQVVRPVSEMLRTMCSSSQYLAVLETLSYTVRESLERDQHWFHSTDYEDFQVAVETNLED